MRARPLGGARTTALGALDLALVTLLAAAGCSDPARTDGIPIGLLLSYSGPLAANSINSERAVLMAVEAANTAGGVGGKAVVVVARDTRSDSREVSPRARELIEAGAAVFIGPDTTELAVELKFLLAGRTVILPSYATADSNIYKPHSWFVMGATAGRVACELRAQVLAAGYQRPLVIADPNGYNSSLSYELSRRYGFPKMLLPIDEPPSEAIVAAIQATGADAYILTTLPPAASALLYALAATGALENPGQWFLSPTLHTPALLETIPSGMMEGARGVSAGTVATAIPFRAKFAERWQDAPLDDAYAFYDATAAAILALERALAREGTLPTGAGLGPHIGAVTNPGGTQVRWDQLGKGLQLLRDKQEVQYIGLSGALEFDSSGKTPRANTNWWTIGPQGFADVPSQSDCREKP